MKKFYLIIFLVVLLPNTIYGQIEGLDENRVKQSAEEYLQENMNDPSSYQYVSLNFFDIITQADNFDQRLESFNSSLEWYKERDDEQARKYESLISSVENLKSEIGEDINDIACYVFEFNFRGANQFGGIVLINSILYITPEYDVRAIATTDGQRLTTCNDLEEYYDIVRAI